MKKHTANSFKLLLQGVLISLALLFASTVTVHANENTRVTPDLTISADIVENDNDAPISLWQDSMVSHRTPTRRMYGIALRGEFPNILPAFGEAYAALNEQVSAAATSLIESAQALRARSVTFSYEVFAAQNVVSIVMYAALETNDMRELIKSINFDPHTGDILTIADVMGEAFPALAVRKLDEWTRANPARFYNPLTAPLGAFYTTGEMFVLLFDEFQIRSEEGSLRRKEFLFENIIAVRPILPIEYRPRPDIFNLKMVPIVDIVRYMGYYAAFNPLSGRVRVWTDEERNVIVSDFTPRHNEFFWGNVRSRAVQLESPPYVHDGVLLVPITIFDRVIPRTAYFVDEYSRIHFLAYRG
jgi:hypothetical protein